MKKFLISIIVLSSFTSCTEKNEFKIEQMNGSGDSIVIGTDSVSAKSLKFEVSPVDTTSMQAIAPNIIVKVVDQDGRTITSSNAEITLAFESDPSSSAATLGGTTSINAVNGVATFSDITVDKALSGYSLKATSPGILSDTSSSFNITVGVASGLAFISQPSVHVVNHPLNPGVQVAIVDAGGNTITSASGNIDMAISNNPVSANLTGTTSEATVSGIATFSDLVIDSSSSAYTLEATSTGLNSSISDSFNIVEPYKLNAGYMFTCVDFSSSVKCFGQNANYELGNGTDEDTSYMLNPAPTNVLDESGNIATDISSMIMAPSGLTNCSILNSSEVRCMGMGAYGERSDGTFSNTAFPTYVQTSAGVNLTNVTDLSVEGNRSCFVSNSNLFCSGDNQGGSGQRHQVISGDCSIHLTEPSCNGANACSWNGSSCNRVNSVRYVVNVTSGVAGIENTVVDVANGAQHICILDNANNVKCWGENSAGQLGNGNTTDISGGATAATNVTGLAGDTIVQIQAGCDSTCALLADNTVKCWGKGYPGKNGRGNTDDQTSALRVLDPTGVSNLTNISQMAIGCNHSCFVTNDNKLYCVGQNIESEIAGSSNLIESLPIEHPTLSNIIRVAIGEDHTCALDSSNKVYCWGANYAGESGHTQGSSSTNPIEVLFP